jgi:aminopeptidase
MKIKNLTTSLCAFSVIFLSSAFAKTQPNYDSIADKMVNHSLRVQPGESIVISGTPAELALLEALSVATSKAGGKPIIQLNIPQANKRAIMETPLKYLEMPSSYDITQMEHVDGFINVGSIQNPALFSDVPEERLAAVRQAAKPFNKAVKVANFRSVSLGQIGGIPTKKYAEFRNANFTTMLSNFWNAVDTDYNHLDTSARKLIKLMKSNTKVKLTSKSGTDLKFELANDVDPRINAGAVDGTSALSGPAQVWLPAGEVYACTNPVSTSGTLVVPSMPFRGATIENLKIKFKKGRMISFSAKKNEKLLKDYFASSNGDYGVLALIDIGLNPSSQPMKKSDYYSWEMAGVVSLSMGNNNWAGCAVESDAGLSFNLSGTTLKFDNETVVNKGRLNDAIGE